MAASRKPQMEQSATPRLSEALDSRIAEMRQLLTAMRPASTASLLRDLREAFPDVPLVERVRALNTLRRH